MAVTAAAVTQIQSLARQLPYVNFHMPREKKNASSVTKYPSGRGWGRLPLTENHCSPGLLDPGITWEDLKILTFGFIIDLELIDLGCTWAAHTESPLESGNSRVLFYFNFLKRRFVEGFTGGGLQQMIFLVCRVIFDIQSILSFFYPMLHCAKAVYYFELPPHNG